MSRSSREYNWFNKFTISIGLTAAAMFVKVTMSLKNMVTWSNFSVEIVQKSIDRRRH